MFGFVVNVVAVLSLGGYMTGVMSASSCMEELKRVPDGRLEGIETPVCLPPSLTPPPPPPDRHSSDCLLGFLECYLAALGVQYTTDDDDVEGPDAGLGEDSGWKQVFVCPYHRVRSPVRLLLAVGAV